MSKKIVTRFAPTPSGFLHMGNIWNLLLTEDLARSRDGQLWLRVDDLDRARYRPEYVDDVFGVANWLGVRFDEGPRNVEDFEAHWSQSHRLGRYHEALHALVATGRVFACSCSRKDVAAASSHGEYPGTCLDANIPLHAPDMAWRFRMEGKPGSAQPEAVHPVVRRRDGTPAYHITTIVDDVDMEMTHIVRGKDLAPSTSVQRSLAEAMGGDFDRFNQISFLHHDLVTAPDGAKLSKSAGSSARSLLAGKKRPAEEVRHQFEAWRKTQVRACF